MSLSSIGELQALLDSAQKERDEYRTALHDIFELASRQKSNRNCATPEGLISTALAAVRVIRRVADESKANRQPRDAATVLACDLCQILITNPNPDPVDLELAYQKLKAQLNFRNEPGRPEVMRSLGPAPERPAA